MFDALTVIAAAILVAFVAGMLLSLPVMWLWNACLVGAIAGVNEITWMQAWGIMLLCGFLFKTTVEFKK